MWRGVLCVTQKSKKMSTFSVIMIISALKASLWLAEDLQCRFVFVFLSKHCGFISKEVLFSFWHEYTSFFSFERFCWAAAQV